MSFCDYYTVECSMLGTLCPIYTHFAGFDAFDTRLKCTWTLSPIFSEFSFFHHTFLMLHLIMMITMSCCWYSWYYFYRCIRLENRWESKFYASQLAQNEAMSWMYCSIWENVNQMASHLECNNLTIYDGIVWKNPFLNDLRSMWKGLLITCRNRFSFGCIYFQQTGKTIDVLRIAYTASWL